MLVPCADCALTPKVLFSLFPYHQNTPHSHRLWGSLSDTCCFSRSQFFKRWSPASCEVVCLNVGVVKKLVTLNYFLMHNDQKVIPNPMCDGFSGVLAYVASQNFTAALVLDTQHVHWTLCMSSCHTTPVSDT